MKIDKRRLDDFEETGIYVRAQDPDGKWISTDISNLDKESLIEYLGSQGQKNTLAENIVGILLGHGHLHTAPKQTEEEDHAIERNANTDRDLKEVKEFWNKK